MWIRTLGVGLEEHVDHWDQAAYNVHGVESCHKEVEREEYCMLFLSREQMVLPLGRIFKVLHDEEAEGPKDRESEICLLYTSDAADE